MQDPTLHWVKRGSNTASGTKIDFHYTIKAGDRVIECTWTARSPAQYIVGSDTICETLSTVLLKMSIGSEVTFTAPAKNVFGHMGLPASNVGPDVLLSFRVAVLSMTVGEEMAADLEDLFETANSLKGEGNSKIQSDMPTAKKCYLDAIDLFHSHRSKDRVEVFLCPFYLNLAMIDLKQKNLNAALSNCEHVLKWSPENTSKSKAHYRIGEALLESKEYVPARWHFCRANALAPSSQAANQFKKIGVLIDEEKKRVAEQGFFFGSLQASSYSANKVN